MITDTVGFLHQLPHHLIEAFKATLEETQDAEVLLHVLDASHPLALEQAEAVQEVLKLLALRDKPIITVLNKRDQVRDPLGLSALTPHLPNPVAISALRGEGLEELLGLITAHLKAHAALP